MTQAKNFGSSNSFHYPSPEEIERAILEANHLRNEYIGNLVIKGWNSLRVWRQRQCTQKTISELDSRLVRDVGLIPQQRKRSLG